MHQFAFDPYRLDWVLVTERVVMPNAKRVTYALHKANHARWKPEFRQFIVNLEKGMEPASLAPLVEQAVGMAINTRGEPILDVTPASEHAKSSLILAAPTVLD